MKTIVFQLLHRDIRSSRGPVETIEELQKVLQLRSQNYIELHVEKFRKRGNQIKIEDKKMNYRTLILVKLRYLKK